MLLKLIHTVNLACTYEKLGYIVTLLVFFKRFHFGTLPICRDNELPDIVELKTTLVLLLFLSPELENYEGASEVSN